MDHIDTTGWMSREEIATEFYEMELQAPVPASDLDEADVPY